MDNLGDQSFFIGIIAFRNGCSPRVSPIIAPPLTLSAIFANAVSGITTTIHRAYFSLIVGYRLVNTLVFWHFKSSFFFNCGSLPDQSNRRYANLAYEPQADINENKKANTKSASTLTKNSISLFTLKTDLLTAHKCYPPHPCILRQSLFWGFLLK